MDQRAAQAQLLLHAARQLARRTFKERMKPGRAGQAINASGPVRTAEPEQFAEEVEILAHRKIMVQVPPQTLRHESNAPAHARAVAGIVHVATQTVHSARLQAFRAGDQPHQRGFSYTVGANQPDHARAGQR